MKKIFLSIGNFDGVHLGHQKIISALIKKAQGKDIEKCVLTFSPHPVQALSPRKTPHLLTSLEHKKKMLFDMGIDSLYVMEFDKALSKMSAENFIKHVLKDKLQVSEIFVGENFAIGPKKQGTIEKMKPFLKKAGIKISIVKSKRIKGEPVSSTIIRKKVLSGEVKEAQKLLGKRYSVLGTVVKGEGVGRRLGFPTANIDPHNEIIPLCGVYPVHVLLLRKWYKGLVNIGYRPTLKGKERTIEVHLLDFNKNVYGKDMEIFFEKRLRSEKKFKNVENLKKQIRADIQKARKEL
jgi:riboflavin kinase/FMN adenylyltransferase